jgi:PAS domain S-box-containing protein
MGEPVTTSGGGDSGPAVYGDLRRLRRVFTWFGVTAMAGFAAGVPIVLSNGDVLFAVILAVAMVPVAASFLLIRRDRLEASAIFLALTMFAALTTLATMGLGIHHISNFAFAVVLLISSMVTRKRTLVALTLVAVGCVAWLVFGELSGAYTPKPLERSVPGDFFSATVVIVVTSLLARLLTETLLKNNLRLHQELVERKRAEELVRESESRFRAFVEQAPVAIGVFNLQGIGLYGNTKFAQTLGLGSAQEMVGRAAVGYFTAESRGESMERTRRRQQGLPVPPEFESIAVHSDGSEFPVHLAVAPIRLAGEAVSIVFLTDITERKRAETEKIRLEAQLRQAQKMESVGRLAGGVAHDFNNMLSVILGNAELALDESAPGHPVRAFLQEISAAAGRSADLTRQLLAFARKQAIVPKVLDLDATVEGMLKMLRRLIGEEIALAWLPGTATWPVRLDPSQVDQVLANLCVNARDAIAGVGTVTIQTSNASLDEAWCNAHAQGVPGDYVMISVSDNGSGMDRDTTERLFEPFFTTKEEGRGTGLGLATVYGIVSQNNGIIDVQSERGVGSTFRIYLPRHAGELEEPEKGPTDGPARMNSETVLLVEDERAVLNMVKTMLQKIGYSVLSASKPGEAIRLAERHDGEIHLLVTDVIMPEMNGRELSRKLCARHPRLKCLFTSGYTADIMTHHDVLDEGVDFLQKPYSMSALAAKVRAVLDA